jgi:hypothetical protein
MTARQIAAKVAQHFAAPIDNKPVTSKKSAKQEGTQATSGKRMKKSGK